MTHFADTRSLFNDDETPITPVHGRLPSYISDHRKRLRERFLTGGSDAVPDYEVLELILFRAIPRQDVKPLAYALIAKFGSFNQVLSASLKQLLEVDGVGHAVATELKIIEAAAHRLAKTNVLKRHIVSN